MPVSRSRDHRSRDYSDSFSYQHLGRELAAARRPFLPEDSRSKRPAIGASRAARTAKFGPRRDASDRERSETVAGVSRYNEQRQFGWSSIGRDPARVLPSGRLKLFVRQFALESRVNRLITRGFTSDAPSVIVRRKIIRLCIRLCVARRLKSVSPKSVSRVALERLRSIPSFVRFAGEFCFPDERVYRRRCDGFTRDRQKNETGDTKSEFEGETKRRSDDSGERVGI